MFFPSRIGLAVPFRALTTCVSIDSRSCDCVQELNKIKKEAWGLCDVTPASSGNDPLLNTAGDLILSESLNIPSQLQGLDGELSLLKDLLREIDEQEDVFWFRQIDPRLKARSSRSGKLPEH